MGFFLILIAVVLFALAAFGGSIGGIPLVPLGLAFFAGGVAAGAGWPWPRSG